MIALVGAAWGIGGGDPDPEHDPVGMFYTFSDAAGGAEVCTGTLLAPQAVLTAAHCADTVHGWQNGGFEVFFVVGPSLDDVVEAEPVDRIDVHPDWDLVTLTADVGVAVLTRPIDAASPLPIGDPQLVESDVGSPLLLVGWGGTASDGSGSGTRRVGTVGLAAFDDAEIQVEETVGQSSCPGDSGGPVLRVRENGETDVVSVTSWGTFTDLDCGPVGGGVRLEVYRDWVEAQVAATLPAEDTGAPSDLDPTIPAAPRPTCGCATPHGGGLGWLGGVWLLIQRRRAGPAPGARRAA
jgi:trypsin